MENTKLHKSMAYPHLKNILFISFITSQDKDLLKEKGKGFQKWVKLFTRDMERFPFEDRWTKLDPLNKKGHGYNILNTKGRSRVLMYL